MTGRAGRWLVAVVPLVVALLLWRWGRVLPAIVALSVGAACLVPAVGSRVQRVAEVLAVRVGNGLAVLLFSLLWFVAVLPASVVVRLLRRDPLRIRSSARTWQRRVPESTPHARRQFAELPDTRPVRPVGVLQRAWNLAGVLLVLLVANYLAGWAWEAIAGPRSDVGARAVIDVDVVESPAPTTVPPYDASRAEWPPDPLPNWLLTGRLGSLADAPWAPEYVYDMEQRTYEPYPYLGAKPVPLRTRYINLRGWERRTYAPAMDPGDAPVVWMFGGSTTWGVGQRDGHTIPSEIARLSEAAGTPVVVRNFGQVSWLNWQEMLLFEHLLVTERRLPDLVVFYDGVNEFALPPPYDHPAPRSFVPDVQAAVGADPADSLRVRGASLRDAYQRRSFVGRLWHEVSEWLDPPASAATVGQAWDDDDEVRAAARNYDRGAAIIRHLAAEHRIPVLLLWQPRLAGRERHDAIRERVTAPVVDISDALDGHPEVYLDDMHTDEDGARIVARRIWELAEQRLASAGRSGQSGSKTTSPPAQGG